MALNTMLEQLIKIVPQLLAVPSKRLWSSYDEKADVLYITFKRPSHADDSELTNDDIIIRYEKDEIVGLTILHASTRTTQS